MTDIYTMITIFLFSSLIIGIFVFGTINDEINDSKGQMLEELSCPEDNFGLPNQSAVLDNLFCILLFLKSFRLGVLSS